MPRAIAIGLAMLALAMPAAAATAESLYERCGEENDCTEKWYWLGETLFRYEAGARATVGAAAKACLAADSDIWHAAVDRACTGPACVEAAYMDRIASLDALQPGANAITGVELPAVPTLLAVLGSETGEAPDASGEPLTATGNLVWASRNMNHMGLALKADAGAAHVIVFDMDIGNQPGHDVLMNLIESAESDRFLVRGTAEAAPDGVPNFNTDQCRFVYRLPD